MLKVLKVFPDKDIPKHKTVPDEDRDSFCYTVFHVDHDANCSEWTRQCEAIKAVSFTEDDVKRLLNEMSFVELAHVVPKVWGVTMEIV
jgi:hypothetical protein